MTESSKDDRDKQIDQSQLEEALESIEAISGLKFSLIDSIRLFRIIGYGLLIMTLFDVIDTFVPPRFMDAQWEFQTVAALVGRVPIPLMGLLLVFYGTWNWRADWERHLLRIISWAVLLAGIGYFLFIPLVVVDSLRIDINNNNQISQQLSQQTTQIENLKIDLEAVKTQAQMQALLSKIQGLPPNIQESQQLEETKQTLSNFVAEREKKLKQEVEQARSEKRQTLIKQSVKLTLGALVSGILFIFLWSATQWARLPW
jgi:hypothetical protein